MCKKENDKYISNSDNYWNSSKVIELFSNAKVKDYIKDFFERYDLQSDIRVADLGCGAGRYTIWLARKGFDVYACDASRGMLDKTIEGLRKIGYQNIEGRVVLSRLEELSFNDDMFDVVLTNGVIHNVYTVEEFLKCIKECVRVLKKDGILYLSIFTSDIIDERLEKIDEHVYLTPDGLRMVLFSKEEIICMLRDSNYEVLDVCVLNDIRVETGVRSLFRATFQKSEL